MIVATVIEVFRENNKIVGYRLQSNTNEVKDVTSNQLKVAVKNKKVFLTNYKLTTDNRLIQSYNTNDIDRYYIMNKDIIVAEFNIFLGTFKIFKKLPLDFKDLEQWLDCRKRFSCVRDVKSFFESIGIKDTRDFIEVTHCVSLHDTFWVKHIKSNLKWKNVSPYCNNYSDIISTYALEGINLGINGKNYFSPVVGTDGSFPHTWKYSKESIKFIKAGSKYTLGGSNSGREPFSEYFASQLGKYLGFNCVEYSIRNHIRYDKRVDIITECECFTSESIGSVTAHNLNLDSYERVIDYCKSLSKNAYNTCLDMLFLDCLLLNTDRHFSNIEFLVNNDTLEVLDIAPIFDNNYSLLPRFIEGYDTFNRDDYIARDNRTFEELYNLIKEHKSYQKVLINLKTFKFTAPKNVKISDVRLNFLNSFLNCQIDYLLSL